MTARFFIAALFLYSGFSLYCSAEEFAAIVDNYGAMMSYAYKLQLWYTGLNCSTRYTAEILSLLYNGCPVQMAVSADTQSQPYIVPFANSVSPTLSTLINGFSIRFNRSAPIDASSGCDLRFVLLGTTEAPEALSQWREVGTPRFRRGSLGVRLLGGVVRAGEEQRPATYDYSAPWVLYISAAEDLVLSALSATVAILGLFYRPRAAAALCTISAAAMALAWIAAAAAAGALSAGPTAAGGGDVAGGAQGAGLMCGWHAASWLLFGRAFRSGAEVEAPARAALLGAWVVAGRLVLDFAVFGDPGNLAADPPVAAAVLAAAAVAAWIWQQRGLSGIAAKTASDRAALRAEWSRLTDPGGGVGGALEWAVHAEEIRAAAAAAAAGLTSQARPVMMHYSVI